MFNVTFYEDEITSSNSPKITNEFYLESLVDAQGFFYNWSASDTFNKNLNSLQNGNLLLSFSKIKSFNSRLNNLIDGSAMFFNCTNLISFNSYTPHLTIGTQMFYNCTSLTAFDTNVLNVKHGM